MSDKIKKFLARLSPKELSNIRRVLTQIEINNLQGLDVKPLKGNSGFIRVRVGRVRIIIKQTSNGYEIIHLTNRNEKTYKGL